MKLMRYPFKKWRAWYLYHELGDISLVCFTCGNCGKALKDYFTDVVVVGKDGDFTANRWFTDAEIENIFVDRTDATSGNLPITWIDELGDFYKAIIGDLSEDEIYYVPTGSGETIISLIHAYPNIKFVAVYNLDDATKYEEQAPLNESVRENAYDVIMEGKEYVF